jgi:MFS transporter, SET family, sugar efflux transporter
VRTGTIGRLFPLALVFLAVGISTALFHPFLALFLSTEVKAGPVRVTAFLIAAPLAGVIAAWGIGRLSDRRAIRRALLIGAALAGVAGSALAAVVRDYWVLLGLAVTAFALAGSLFPQTFAYARQVLQRDDPARVAMGISAMRTVFSVAWVAGPPLAAVLLQAGGFRYVYGAAALTYVIAALVPIFWLDEVGVAGRAPAEVAVAATGGRIRLLLTGAAFTLFMCPLTLAVQTLPLFVGSDLGGQASDAGLILGLCAALEIPLILALGALSTRVSVRRLLYGGAACGILYYGLATTASNVGLLFAGQPLNALFIAAVSGLGIAYVQDMLPGQPGRASTLHSNTFPIGAGLAGPFFGLGQHFGYRLPFAIATALCVAGLLVLVIADARRRPQSDPPRPQEGAEPRHGSAPCHPRPERRRPRRASVEFRGDCDQLGHRAGTEREH